MKLVNWKKPFLSLALLAFSSIGFAQTAEEIVDKWDNARSYPSSRTEGVITVQTQFKTTNTSFISFARGKIDMLIQFTSGQEKGQKILRGAREIRLFYPDSDKTLIVKGAQLRQSILGSDISYEDLTNTKTTNEDYNVKILATEQINGQDTWKIELKGKVSGLAYPNQILWISKKDPVALKGEYYSSTQKLLKEMTAEDYVVQEGYIIVTHMTFKDALKKNSQTSFKVDKIDLHAVITDSTFSRINTSF
jgi:hypothetical protein